MEPWDGPAAICGFAGNWAIAGMDRNGLRPMRFTITADGLLLAGSETGMVKGSHNGSRTPEFMQQFLQATLKEVLRERVWQGSL